MKNKLLALRDKVLDLRAEVNDIDVENIYVRIHLGLICSSLETAAKELKHTSNMPALEEKND